MSSCIFQARRAIPVLAAFLLIIPASAQVAANEEADKARKAAVLMLIVNSFLQQAECTAAEKPYIHLSFEPHSTVETKQYKEGESAVFYLRVDSLPACELLVGLDYSGTASEPADYTAEKSAIYRESGYHGSDWHQLVRPIPLRVDDLVEGTESIVVSIKDDSSYRIGDPSSIYINLLDSVTLSISSNAASLSENDDAVSITVRRTGDDLSADLSFTLSFAGSATYSDDYLLSGQRTIVAGEGELHISLEPLKDGKIEGVETIELQIDESDAYRLSNESQVSLNLEDYIPHPCAGNYTHTGVACATFWGCDPGTFFIADNFICYTDSYDEITSSTLDLFTCEPGYENCEYVDSSFLSGRENLQGGAYKLLWNDDNNWMTITPLNAP